MKYNISEQAYEITQDIAIRVAKGFDSAIFMTIKQIAKENGIEHEVVLNETAIVNAFKKQIPIKPYYEGDGYYNGELVYDYAKCPECGNDKFEYGINNWGCKYCPDCGQALDWSDTK